MLVLLLVLASVIGACSSDGPADRSTGPARRTTDPNATTTTTASPRAEVIDPGAAPRRQLRLVLTEGQTATVAYTSDTQVVQTSGRRRQSLDAPPISAQIRYEVTHVDADGAATLRTEISDPTVHARGTDLDDAQVKRFEEALQGLDGLTATATLLPDGRTTDVRFRVPAGADATMRSVLDSLSGAFKGLGQVLPDEPVGVGAAWEVRSIGRSMGVDVTSTTRITVTALDDEGVTYTSATESSAADQDLEGVEGRLISVRVTGTGQGKMPLRSLAYELRARLSGTERLEIGSGGSKTQVRQELEVAYAARPR